MSTQQWKPGDVAMVRDERGATRVAVRTNLIDARHHWAYDEVGIGRILSDIRPLVVIDPEDLEQVAKLVGGWVDQGAHLEVGVSRMQAALRSLVVPPKPEEPTGLGAVVEDADGKRWTRVGRTLKSWYAAHGHWAKYADINAVHILSEGVTA